MDLWIRSQNRLMLPKCSMVFINYNDKKEILGVVGTSLENDNNNNIRLGYYETEERALEILDEIQNNILGIEKRYSMDIGEYNTDVISKKVYEMPQE